MPSGVYKHKLCSEEMKNKLREINRNRQNNGKENILHTAIEFLEKEKEKKDIDVNLINGWQKDIKTLGEAIAFSFNEAFEKKYKPIRKVWFVAIKSKEKDVKKFEEMFAQVIENIKGIFPEAKITISLCKKGYSNGDVMIRNEIGQFEVIKEEKE